VSVLGVSVGFRTVLVSSNGVFPSQIVTAVFMFMRGLKVMVGRRGMMCRRCKMVLNRRVICGHKFLL
jgi:hypothetical protein